MKLITLCQITLLFCTGFQASLSLAGQQFSPELLAAELKDESPKTLIYEETRESPWLDAPVISQGTMKATPPMLEKISGGSSPQTWRLYSDQMEWIDAEGVKTLFYKDYPQLGILAQALRGVVFGDFNAIPKDLDLLLEGSPDSWYLRLTPSNNELSKLLRRLEFYGVGSKIKKFIITEEQGEITTTELSLPPKY